MRYRFYLRINLPEGNSVRIGENHEIQWDNRDIISASSGWLIVNQEKVGMASDVVIKLYRGIQELKNSPDNYRE